MADSVIRVGIIRCDTHALYYAALMDDIDTVFFRTGMPPKRNSPGMSGGLSMYLCTDYTRPYELTVPNVKGFRIVKIWDKDRNVAECLKKLLNNRPIICEQLEDVSEDVDLVFIADCNGNGSDKLKLATPGLKKGIPTFIDKPLAYEYSEAKKIMELAKVHNTPVLSLSMLRELPHATRFKQRFPELGEIDFGIIKGGGITMAGHVHAISLAQHLFGDGVESVECMGKSELGFVHLNYEDGKKDKPRKGVMLNCDSGRTKHCSFYSSVYGPGGAIHSPNMGDFEFPFAAIKILEKIKEMLLTRKCPVPENEMLENIAVATAARIAQQEKKLVMLSDIIDKP